MKKILLFLSLSLISLISTAQLPTSLRDGTLVCYYQMDKALCPDSSGNGHNLFVNAGTGISQSTSRVSGGTSLLFDNSGFNGTPGSVNYLKTNNGNFLPIDSSSRTISLWVKSTNITTHTGQSGQNIFLSYGSNSTGNLFEIGPNDTSLSNNGYLYFSCKRNFQSGVTNYTNKVVSDNIWHNIVITYNGITKILCIYTDSMLINKDTILLNTSTSNLYIGSRLGLISGFIDQTNLDDIAIWNRALNSSEIDSLFMYNGNPLSSKTLGKSNLDFNIFPNPASSEINISIDIKKESKLLIINELGKVIKNVILTQDNSKVDVSDLQKGIYFLIVENKSKKLIIN